MDRQSRDRRLDLRESGPAYHAFTHFRELPTRGRSLDAAYTAHRQRCHHDRSQAPDLTSVSGTGTVVDYQRVFGGFWRSDRRAA